MEKQEVITGDRYLELMWPLNDMFRSRLNEFRALPYDASFEAEVDAAIAGLADNPVGAWGELSLGAWRVLLERHEQMMSVAGMHMLEGVPLITLPPGPELPDGELRVGLALLFLLQMTLPLPPADRSRHEIPQAPAAKGH